MTQRSIDWSGVLVLTAAAAIVGVIGFQLASWPPEPPAPAAWATRPLPSSTSQSPPVSLWVGDSYTAGKGVDSVADAESCLTAGALGWVCNVDAQGGTGFLTDGHDNDPSFQPLAGRLPGDKDQYLADVVVVDAGRNDGHLTPALKDAIRGYLDAVEETYPDAEVVMIAPYWVGVEETADPDVAAFMRAEMDARGGHLVDPVEEGWISPESTRRMVSSDGRHPNARGHRYIARHLAEDLERIDLDLG